MLVLLLTLLLQVAVPAPAPQCIARGPLPSDVCTPGATNPLVTQDNIQQTICVRGWTATIRPPVSLTNRLKHEAMVAYGYDPANAAAFELDHLLALEVGGAPGAVQQRGVWLADPDALLNLWPQAYDRDDELDARTKDIVENASRRAVCEGRVPLATMQQGLMTDWVQAAALAGIDLSSYTTAAP